MSLHSTNAPAVLDTVQSSVADVAHAGLVEEGVPGVVGVARDLLLPGAVLPLDAVAAQVAALDAGFAALDPAHLGDLGQGAGLRGRSAARPGGHGAAGGGGRGRFCNSAAETGDGGVGL